MNITLKHLHKAEIPEMKIYGDEDFNFIQMSFKLFPNKGLRKDLSLLKIAEKREAKPKNFSSNVLPIENTLKKVALYKNMTSGAILFWKIFSLYICT